jgi:hypothetical protein
MTIPQTILDKINIKYPITNNPDIPAMQVTVALQRGAAEWGAFELDKWISVKDELPALTEPLMWYNDETNKREVMFENDHATVLGFDSEKGVVKAVLDKHGWSEISSISISGCVNITHWQPLPSNPL